jgi:hypothetical protein
VALRPLVVRLPGVRAALEEEVGRAVVGDDEDDVALVAVGVAGELAEVDAADPDLRNVEGDGRLPLALAEAELTDRGVV